MDRLVHDLREPLRSINVFTELLEEKSNARGGTGRADLFREIYGGAARIRTLLDALANYSLALHETTAASVPAVSSLQSAFRIVRVNLQPEIEATGATVTGENLPRIGLTLERAMQLLENLIGNSLRFRGAAAPVIRVTSAEDVEGMCAVSVEDNGMGIAPEDCEAIFQPFMKVEGKKFPGAGLGLSICRQIVEAHGGGIHMKSTPGKGSICTFTLPEA
ncbi:MAG: HAMP domain-containing histidine kinase [Acidobacteriota bacterium]|nr:HAMP domain-containing histidine kinase [Acidobacteriota bacterium]